MGSGKTTFLSRVFNLMPPSIYNSTGVAEQSFRGLLYHIGTRCSWEPFSYEKLLTLVTKNDTPMLELIHMIDTGGLPEYMEFMPGLIHSCNFGILVINLLYDVDEHPPIHYVEKGKTYNRALQSQYSNRQMVQRFAATFQAKRFSQNQDSCFRLISIATHSDCLPESELSARVKAYHKALRGILLPAYANELIFYSQDEIPFVLNLKTPDNTDIDKLNLIRQTVRESGVGEVVKTPGAFLIFEQELAVYAEKVGRSIISLGECMEIGAKLKMESDIVKAALMFFHRLFTFLYYPDVLPNLVFTKPRQLLDIIDGIVQFSLNVKDGRLKGVTMRHATSLRDGIISEELLSHKELSKWFIPGLYEPNDTINFLCYTHTIAPLHSEPGISSKKSEYLMMSLCQVIPDKDIPRYTPTFSDIAPLVVQFTNNCVPLSCFNWTISCLLAMYNWKLNIADDGSAECLAHNIVSIFNPQMPVLIILVDMGHSIQIHIKVDKDTDPSLFPDICFQVRETVFTVIEHVFKILHLAKIEISPAFICACPREPRNHTASVYQFKSQWFLNCSIVENNVGAAEKKHTMWLDSPMTETMKPSLPKLLEFKVPEKVGSNYSIFGVILLNDEDGGLLDVIENDCHGNPERIILRILTIWIQGRGKPVTWNALIETLRSCSLNEVADQIHAQIY